MTLGLVVRKSLRHHALSTTITALSIGLAGALLMSIWVVKSQSHETFTRIDGGFDGVLGTRSSKLQIVLNAVFHLEASPANIEWQDYTALTNHPGVALGVPIAMGDNYRGFRIVGTVPEMLTQTEYAPGQRYRVKAPGRIFDISLREAVVGSFVAQRLNLKRGDHFHPYHGLSFDEEHEHAEEYVVVGILEPSNTPADRVIWIPLEGVQKMSGHATEAATQISAVLVKLKTPMAGQTLDQQYNKKDNKLTFAWPIGTVMADLLAKISWFDRVLALVAYLVAIVAAGSILASIYNSMNERRRQIAILRALGARRAFVSSSIVCEAAGIALIGMIAAFVIYAIITSVAASVVRAQTGVVIDPWAFHPIMIGAPLGLIALAALVGLVPAMKAYQV
ncbi:MAG: FtsX-like permease family protein, partial [Phycisphaerales bacterium]|nr:FtsX-like permease family protein [Phycisphaerales bacterium]